MSLNLNPWVALILGILIGWLLEWLLELWFFRKRRLECQDRLAGAEAQLGAQEAELSEARAKAASLEADLTGVRMAAAVPLVQAEAFEAEVEVPEVKLEAAEVALEAPAVQTGLPGTAVAAPGIGVGGAAVAAGLGALALAGEKSEAAVAAPAVEAGAAEVALEAPAVQAGLPGIAVAAPGIGVGGAAVAAGLGALALAGEKSEAAVAAPAVEAGAAEVALEAPAVQTGLPGMAVAAPEVGLGGAALAAGIGAGLAGLGDIETDTRAGQVAVAAPLPAAAPHIEPDDLALVKGIGPKYIGLLNAAGITTYAALAHTPADRLEEIIDAPAWRKVDYQAWIAEARILAEAPRRMVVGDDLTALEGIGPVYAAKLKHANIATFADLAAADEAHLADVIQAPAWRRVNFGEWIEQAKLAAVGDAVGLKALQAQLFSREGDNIGLIGGIGEKAVAALNAAGITTYAALAESTPGQLAAVTAAAGVRAGDFASWIEEARLRAAGKRIRHATRRSDVVIERKVSCPQDLSRIAGVGAVYETKLYEAGIGTYWELCEIADQDLVRVLGVQDFQAVDIVAVKADALKLAEETDSVGRYWDGTSPDDFEQLEGIGEVFERRLYDAGICTFRALAELTEERLQEICQAPDWRKPDYAAWIARARQLIG